MIRENALYDRSGTSAKQYNSIEYAGIYYQILLVLLRSVAASKQAGHVCTYVM